MAGTTTVEHQAKFITAALVAVCAVLLGLLAFGPWSGGQDVLSESPPEPVGSVVATTPQVTTSSPAAEESSTTAVTTSTQPATTTTSSTTTTTRFVFDFGGIDPEAIIKEEEEKAAPPKKAASGGVPPATVPPVPAPPAGFDLRPPTGGTTHWAGTGDAADPFILKTQFGFFAYTTNTSSAHVPVWYSADLVNWELLVDALPTLPDWAVNSGTQTWAPAAAVRNGSYVLYFTTQHAFSGRQCIGVARSAEATGPFVAESEPIVCQTDLGGSIDPSVFTDASGVTYLLWKNDGNCCRIPTRIFTQPLSGDGLSLTGSPSEILWSTQGWEAAIIEGPSMVQVGNVFHLMYSAGKWNEGGYGIGHAACVSPVGPCYKTSQSPWQRSAGGPGGEEFFTDASGNIWIVFHEWRISVGYPKGIRSMYLRPVGFAGAPPATTTTTTVAPETTVPDSLVPETTVPPTTLPPTTVPPTSAPDTTVPPTSVPPTSVPDTAPPTSVPDTAPPTTVLPTSVPDTPPPTTVPSTEPPAETTVAPQTSVAN